MCGGHHFQETGHQPGMVANPACGQLNRENGILLVPVRYFGVVSFRFIKMMTSKISSNLSALRVQIVQCTVEL